MVRASAETYVLSVGISNYADSKVHNLAKPEKDAKAMAEFYRLGGADVVTITGKYASKTQIIKSLRSRVAKAQPGDKIVFYFSGHGYPGGFCPYDMRKIEDGLTYGEVLGILNASKAKDKFIFADACNSGAIRQNGSTPSEAGSVLFFLSSRGNESSMESPFLANGYFTKSLLRGLRGAADVNKDRSVTASELFQYVSGDVQQQTRGTQHPVMWGKFPHDLVVVSYGKK